MDKILVAASNGLRREEPNSSGVSLSTDVAMPSPSKAAAKRKTDGSEDCQPPAKKPAPTIRVDGGFKWNLQALAKAADAVGSGGKSPVSALNELGLKVHYSITKQEGPAHCPNFNVTVTVANMTFRGAGHSKREARASAARACLAALLARAGRVLPQPGPPPDFTSDDPAKYTIADFQCLEARGVRPTDNKIIPMPNLFGPSAVLPTAKSPINILHEQYPGLTFKCTFGDGSPLDSPQAPAQLSHSMRFKVVCQIKDQLFEGYGSSKKLAKLATARAALGELCERGVLGAELAPADALPQLLADHVAKIVNEKFNELMRGDLVHSKRKVLAGIVITVENNIESAKVIAVATGTKCVSGEHISVRGQAVNDGHAEVVARRCLQRFLYSQLLLYANAEDPTKMIPESELEPIPGGGYQMKEDRRVHLYVSTAPCGDGRIFSPHENYNPEPDRHPNRLARGQLRTKIESGEGTIPVKNSSNVVQTWDGLLQGERLLTMSCSDKMARWCVLGLQGALLGRLLRPVYPHSLVLGSLLHQHHMYRALCGRVEALISSLPPPYQLRRPRLARALSMEARTPARAPSFSVCWAVTAPMAEVINSTTGKLESGHPSLVCKQTMFARWHHLVRRLPLLAQDEASPPLPGLPDDLDHVLYSEAKLLCSPYQEAKECLINAFDRAQLGRWIKKPEEQDQFQCEILNADPTILFAWAGGGHSNNAMQIPPSAGTRPKTFTKTDDVANTVDIADIDKLKTSHRESEEMSFSSVSTKTSDFDHISISSSDKNDAYGTKINERNVNSDSTAENALTYKNNNINNIKSDEKTENYLTKSASKNDFEYETQNINASVRKDHEYNNDMVQTIGDTNKYDPTTINQLGSSNTDVFNIKYDQNLNGEMHSLRRPKSLNQNDYANFDKHEGNIDYNSKSNINIKECNDNYPNALQKLDKDRVKFKIDTTNNIRKRESVCGSTNFKPHILNVKQPKNSSLSSHLKIAVDEIDADFRVSRLDIVENRNREIGRNENRNGDPFVNDNSSNDFASNRNRESSSAYVFQNKNREIGVKENRSRGQFLKDNGYKDVVSNGSRESDSTDVVHNRNSDISLDRNRNRAEDKVASKLLQRKLAAYRKLQRF